MNLPYNKIKGTTMIVEKIEQKILQIRGKKVLLDRDLAHLYAVSTKRLNEQVKRNPSRFPDDFMFRLKRREINEVVANCDHLLDLKFSHSLPYAFTEQGVAMLSSVLNSDRAIAVNIHIMRVFTRLRELMGKHKDLEQRIDALERKYDRKFKSIFEAIRQLLAPPPAPSKPKLPIGFHAFRKPVDSAPSSAYSRRRQMHLSTDKPLDRFNGYG